MTEEINGINSIEPLCTKKAALEQDKQSEREIQKEENASIFDKDTGMPKSLFEIAENPIKKEEPAKVKQTEKVIVKDDKPHYFNHFINGFSNQLTKIIDNIIEHPIKSALILAGTTLGILALPLIGIPSTVGVAVLTILYATASLIKTGINISKFIKHKKENNFEATQKDMEHLGENSFDLALSLPFVPKGIKDINRFAKYGQIGINHSLIGNIKNADGLYGKCNAFFNGTEQLNSDMKVIEIMKQNLPPEKVKEIMPLLKLDNRAFAKKVHEIMSKDMPCYRFSEYKPRLDIRLCRASEAGHYDFENMEIVLNSKNIDMKNKADIVSTLVHEFQHHKQFILIDKANMYKMALRYMSHTKPTSELSKRALIKNFDKHYKRLTTWTEDYFPVKPTRYIRRLIDAKKNYVDIDANYNAYWKNFLEVDARKAQIPVLPAKTGKDAFLQMSNYNKKDISDSEMILDAFLDVTQLLYLGHFLINGMKQKAEL